MATMTLTIELSEEAAAQVRAAADAQGIDMHAFATAAVVRVAASETAARADTDEETLVEVVAACRKGLDDVRHGRVFTLEEADARFETDLAAARLQVKAHLKRTTNNAALPDAANHARNA